MIEEQALVVGIEQDRVLLEIVRRTPCGLCGQTRGCGISVWGRMLGHRNNVFQAVNQIDAKIGDQVVVGVEEKALLASSLAVYGVPLLLVLAGAALGTWLASSAGDAWPLAGAGLGLFFSFLWVKGHATGRSLDARYRPVILRPADTQSQISICHRGHE
ncbi:SoxR reducing system protein RseC [mine drainage metagenome]|uniref:SoxR reducing system protein RseC n=1 Tax=mine drainage metagenome TaxID=410659 RepID=A0A1J5QTK6_9ZZZZ